MVYGGMLPALTASYTGLVNGDTSAAIAGLTLGTAPASSHVGSYPITAAGAADPDYAITLVNGTLTITPASLTVGVNNAAKVYGSSNPAFSVGYTGFVNGDTAAALGGSLTFATSASAASGVGSYPVTASGLTSSDYTIAYAAGTLTITPGRTHRHRRRRDQDVRQRGPVLTYRITAGSLMNGDTLIGLQSRAAGENVGSYAIVQGTLTAGGNYTLTYVGSNLTISPRGADCHRRQQVPRVRGWEPRVHRQLRRVRPGEGGGELRRCPDVQHDGGAFQRSGGLPDYPGRADRDQLRDRVQ